MRVVDLDGKTRFAKRASRWAKGTPMCIVVAGVPGMMLISHRANHGIPSSVMSFAIGSGGANWMLCLTAILVLLLAGNVHLRALRRHSRDLAAPSKGVCYFFFFGSGL
jgi:hypothetical protein